SDGGILNNFPVEPLLGLCDVIVGVCTTSLRAVHRDELTSALSVVQRALEVGIYHNSKAKFHACDVVIQPPGLAAYGAFDTKHAHEICEIGYQAARAHLDAIEQTLAAVV
ncbi:MAG: patatin, partial [bacterium]|nr:patatin [bacterium]